MPFIKKKTFCDIEIQQRPRKLKLNLTCSGVSGSKLKLIGCYLIELIIHGKKIFNSFFIADSLPGKYSAILGIDFAKKHGLSYCSITNSTYFEKAEKITICCNL